MGCESHPPQPTKNAKAEEKAEWVRLNLPTVAAFATAMRAEFGEVRLVYARENGHTIGKASGG